MKLLTIILLTTMTNLVIAAGESGVSGSPEMQLISVTPIDATSSLMCYQKSDSNDIDCVVVID